MKKIIFAAILIIGYMFYTRFNTDENRNESQTQITITELRNNPNVYKDSTVVLHNLTVLEAASVLNYSKVTIEDNSGEKIILISNRPYKRGQIISRLKGTYVLVYQDSDRCYEAFIAEELKPLKEAMGIIKLFI